MKVLVNGVTGSTGILLADKLIRRGHSVFAVVRSPEKIPSAIRESSKFTFVYKNILDLSHSEILKYVKGCDAVASCLGHPMSVRGIWGQPRRLVTEVTKRFCRAIESQEHGDIVKYILMNTAGFYNPDTDEPISLLQKGVVSLLRVLVPPHADNEDAANYLRENIGKQNNKLNWVVVRPDSLIDQEQVSEYQVAPSPTRSAIFNAGKTSRINVADFMTDLLTEDQVWRQWKGSMPVIYNREST